MNTMAATGIVSLPGMMTGQILSGTEPILAVRYQIAIMCAISDIALYRMAPVPMFRQGETNDQFGPLQ